MRKAARQTCSVRGNPRTVNWGRKIPGPAPEGYPYRPFGSTRSSAIPEPAQAYSCPVRPGTFRAGPLLPWAWFTVLGLAVAGPLLGSGYLLLLDFPSGPRFPTFPILPLPSSGDLGNTTPLLAVHALLRSIHPYLRDKAFLLAPLLLGGVGTYRFARGHLGVGALPAIYGATLFVLNPFVRDRYLAGHLHFLLGYALLPWALGPVHDALLGRTRQAAPRMALWLAGLGAVDVHVAGLYALLAVVAAVAAPTRRLALGGVALGLGAVLSAYWLLPAAFAAPGSDIGPADLAVYASRPGGSGVLASLLSMHGFWRDEFPSPAERIPFLYLLLLPIIGLAVAGAVRMLTGKGQRRLGAVLAGAAALALVLAAGTSFPPTAGAFRWVFDHVPLFGVYREPQKFLALVVLAYAVFGAVGLNDALPARDRRVLSRLAAAWALGGVLLYGSGMFWGFGGEVRLSRYPDGWSEAERIMEGREGGRLLALPWHLYAVWSFSGGRIVADPAASFFSLEVLAAGETGFPEVPAQSPDPFRRYLTAALEYRREVRSFGHLVAPLGVRFIAWMREADWEAYRFLERQGDLLLLYEDEQISLYENLAWPGSVMPLSAGEDPGTPADLSGFEDDREATRELRPAPPPVPRQDDDFPPLARVLPHWRTVDPVEGAAFVATGDRCTDGWRLGGEAPRCHLGAVAAFPNPRAPKPLWRPLAGARLAGFGLSAVALLGTALYVRRVSRPVHPPHR